MSNALFTVTGKASDNVGVTQVYCQLNAAGWETADSANGWTNWTAQVTPSPGANVVAAYAEDAAGNPSKTNSVSFVYHSSAPADFAPASLSGLSAEVTAAGDTSALTVSFGAGTFSQTMLPGTNEDNNAVGDYTYAKLSTNAALLTVISTAPPTQGNYTNAVMLTFTNVNDAVFYSTNGDGSVDTGTVLLSAAANLVPASVAGKTIHAVESVSGHADTVVLNAGGTFKNTDHKGQVSSGNYTFTSYSPVGALLVMDVTSPSTDAGAVNYVVVTFSSAKAGTYFSVTVNPAGGTSPTLAPSRCSSPEASSLGSSVSCPGGTFEDSPTFQRRVRRCHGISPEGTADEAVGNGDFSRPCGTNTSAWPTPTFQRLSLPTSFPALIERMSWFRGLQANGLPHRVDWGCSPRPMERCPTPIPRHHESRFQRSARSLADKPRALPWADMKDAVGVLHRRGALLGLALHEVFLGPRSGTDTTREKMWVMTSVETLGYSQASLRDKAQRRGPETQGTLRRAFEQDAIRVRRQRPLLLEAGGVVDYADRQNDHERSAVLPHARRAHNAAALEDGLHLRAAAPAAVAPGAA